MKKRWLHSVSILGALMVNSFGAEVGEDRGESKEQDWFYRGYSWETGGGGGGDEDESVPLSHAERRAQLKATRRGDHDRRPFSQPILQRGISDGSDHSALMQSERGERRKENEESVALSISSVLVSAEKDLSPLSIAIYNYDGPESVEKIIKELQRAKEAGTINQQSQPSGRTALMDLVERVSEEVLLGAPGGGDPGLLQRFLEAGADPNIEGSQRQCAFLIAVRERKYETALRFLDADVPDEQVETAANIMLDDGTCGKDSRGGRDLLFRLIRIISSQGIEAQRGGRWREWAERAARIGNKEIIETILINFLVSAGNSMPFAKDCIKLSEVELRKLDYPNKDQDIPKVKTCLQPLLDAGLGSVVDTEKNKEIQGYFLEKGASRESKYYLAAWEKAKKKGVFFGEPHGKGQTRGSKAG